MATQVLIKYLTHLFILNVLNDEQGAVRRLKDLVRTNISMKPAMQLK